MKKSRLIILLLQISFVSFSYVSAQVSIGSNIKPNVGSLLDLKQRQPTASDSDQSTAKLGLGMPRVSLTNLTQLKPMYSYEGTANTPSASDIEAHIGLIVYNVNEDLCGAVDILKGLYIWNGNNWQILNNEGGSEVQIFKDQEGNDFKARTFGNAGTWMIENLAVMTYSDNTALDIFDGSVTNPPTKSMYAYPSKTSMGWNSQPDDWSRRQGLLYQWRAATNNYVPNGSDYAQIASTIPGTNEVETILENSAGAKNGKIQGICPTGWHLPSDREWNVLEKELYNNASLYSSYTSEEITSFDPLTWQTAWETTSGMRSPSAGTTGHGAVMKSICIPTGSTALTGGKSLSAVKGGLDVLLLGSISTGGLSLLYGERAFFWSSSARSTTTTWQRNIANNNPSVSRSVGSGNVFFSVRCKKD